jgi:hypothetical protein
MPLHPRNSHLIRWTARRQAGDLAEGRHGMEGAGWLAGGTATGYKRTCRREAAHLSLFLVAISPEFRGRLPGESHGRRQLALGQSAQSGPFLGPRRPLARLLGSFKECLGARQLRKVSEPW